MKTIAPIHPSRTISQGPMPLTRRGRLARLAMVISISIVLGAGFSMKAGAGDIDAHVAPSSFVKIVVEPGDTLWSIATGLSIGGDVLSMVDQIMGANSLQVPDVAVGQVLRVPA